MGREFGAKPIKVATGEFEIIDARPALAAALEVFA